MSRVFLAEELSLGRRVVIKVLPPDLAATVNAERFRREIQLAAKLQHPHIVPLLATGITDGLPYYTMPFIEGETLSTRVARTGAMPIYEAEKILTEILSALEYAHQHGIVHRDIKPANILLTGHHAVITDFGVAKAISAATNPDADLTSRGVAVGTPAYMAPEQATAEPSVDHRADLYAVGAVAYEMLTGHQVFGQRSLQAMLAAHAVQTPEPLANRRSSIPPALATIVMRALEKNAADRPQSATAMLAAVEAAIMTTGSAGSYRANGSRATAKWSANRGMLMAMALAVVLLLLSSSSWYWYKRNQVSTDPKPGEAIPSLAVLPFENLGKPEDAYFADGMTDEISNRLGGLGGLRLVGRQSARRYANSDKPIEQIGKELGVTYLLTGTVRWDRSKTGHDVVRVSPELLRASDGTHLWSQPSEDELSGVFKIQSDVAEKVARELQVRLRRGDMGHLLASPTQNLAAYDDYLRGRREFDLNRPDRAIPFLARAANADPKFALALAYLGRARTDAHWYGRDLNPEHVAEGRKAIDSALVLSPELSEAHVALGNFFYHGDLDYDKALPEFAEAVRLAPNNADAIAYRAYVERRQGRWEESTSDLRRAVALDPRNPGIKGGLAENLLSMRQYNASDSLSRQVLEIDSTWWRAYQYLATSAINRNGDTDSALKVLRVAVQKVEAEDRVFVRNFDWLVEHDIDLHRFLRIQSLAGETDTLAYYETVGTIAFLEGDRAAMRTAGDSNIARATRLVRDPKRNLSSTDLGHGYALTGERDKLIANYKKSLSSEWVAKDAVAKAVVLESFGRNAAIVGANDEAIQAFREALSIPGAISRASLRVNPLLASLRRDPRFQQLIAGT